MLQREEHHIRFAVNRTHSDAESRVDALQPELMTAKTSEQACLTSLEGERAACRDLEARLAVPEMRVHTSEHAPAGIANLRHIPCPGDCDSPTQANAALARQGSAMIRMQEAFNKQIMAERAQVAKLQRQIEELKEWQRKATSQRSDGIAARPSSVGRSCTAPAMATLSTSATTTHTSARMRSSVGMTDIATQRGSGPPDSPGGGDGSEPERAHDPCLDWFHRHLEASETSGTAEEC